MQIGYCSRCARLVYLSDDDPFFCNVCGRELVRSKHDPGPDTEEAT